MFKELMKKLALKVLLWASNGDVDRCRLMDGKGGMYNPFDLSCDTIDLEVVATALSRIHRFWGQTDLTVAQHCVMMAVHFEERGEIENALWALFHEFGEAYLGDLATPVKKALPGFKEMEESIMKRMAECYSLPWPMPKAVKELDSRIVIDEALNFMPRPDYWLGFAASKGIEPLGITIRAIGKDAAKTAFLEMADRLLKERGAAA